MQSPLQRGKGQKIRLYSSISNLFDTATSKNQISQVLTYFTNDPIIVPLIMKPITTKKKKNHFPRNRKVIFPERIFLMKTFHSTE